MFSCRRAPFVFSPLEEGLFGRLLTEMRRRLPLEGVVVFGSRVRGEASEDSDLDLALILAVERITPALWRQVWAIKWEVLARLGVEEYPLSLTLIPKREWASRVGIGAVVRQEGVALWWRSS